MLFFFFFFFWLDFNPSCHIMQPGSNLTWWEFSVKSWHLWVHFRWSRSLRVYTYFTEWRFTQVCYLSLVFSNCSLQKNVSCPDSTVENDPAPPTFPWPLLLMFPQSTSLHLVQACAACLFVVIYILAERVCHSWPGHEKLGAFVIF